MQGIFEFEVGEPKKKIGFKFGTMALAVAEKEEGRSLKSILNSLSVGDVNAMLMLNILYGAAVQYADSKKTEKNFTVSDVSDWCEEIGFDKLNIAIAAGLKQYVPKNSESPAKTGEMITQ